MGAGEGIVVDFFDAIFSDFARLEVETSSEDFEQGSAHSAHEKALSESSEDKAVNDIEMKHKTVKWDQLTRLNSKLNKELEGSQVESPSMTASIWASATRLRCSSARRRSSL